MLRAIVAHPIPEEQERISASLEHSGSFTVCLKTHDGLECLRQTLAQAPDLVILDAVLDRMDGLEVLRRLRSAGPAKTKYLFLTTYQNYLSTQAVATGADYCLLEPCSYEVMAQRACQLVVPPAELFTDEEIDDQSLPILRKIAAPEHLKGFRYAVCGARVLVREPELVHDRKVTSQLYETIARQYGTTPARVERCLRSMVQQTWSTGELEALDQYFHVSDPKRSCPTSSVFLATLARWCIEGLRKQRKDQETG